MLRHNTKQELEAVNEAIRNRPKKLIYYNAKSNKYKIGWCSAPACNMYLLSFNNSFDIESLGCFYSLKHPGKGIQVSKHPYHE